MEISPVGNGNIRLKTAVFDRNGFADAAGVDRNLCSDGSGSCLNKIPVSAPRSLEGKIVFAVQTYGGLIRKGKSHRRRRGPADGMFDSQPLFKQIRFSRDELLTRKLAVVGDELADRHAARARMLLVLTVLGDSVDRQRRQRPERDENHVVGLVDFRRDILPRIDRHAVDRPERRRRLAVAVSRREQITVGGAHHLHRGRSEDVVEVVEFIHSQHDETGIGVACNGIARAVYSVFSPGRKREPALCGISLFPETDSGAASVADIGNEIRHARRRIGDGERLHFAIRPAVLPLRNVNIVRSVKLFLDERRGLVGIKPDVRILRRRTGRRLLPGGEGDRAVLDFHDRILRLEKPDFKHSASRLAQPFTRSLNDPDTRLAAVADTNSSVAGFHYHGIRIESIRLSGDPAAGEILRNAHSLRARELIGEKQNLAEARSAGTRNVMPVGTEKPNLGSGTNSD